MKDKFQKLVLVFILVFVATTGNAQTTVGRGFRGVKLIKINTTGGTMNVGRSNTGMVQVTVTFNLDKKDYHPVFEQTDSTLFLKEDFIFKPSTISESIWQVDVPDGLAIQYSSKAGDLNVQNLKIDISASSFSGNYNWKDVTGNSTIESPGGDTEIENYRGYIAIKGRSGNVIISKATGNVEINVGPGDITLKDVTGNISVTTGSGSIQAERVTLTQNSSFNTDVGAAELWLAAPVNSDLSISTKSGPAIIHCKGMKLEGTVVMTANKKSGGIKWPFTPGKTEEVKDEASGVLRIRTTLQLGTSTNSINLSTESGVIVVKK